MHRLTVSAPLAFRASTDRKTAPWIAWRKDGRGVPLANAFGLPAGPRFSCGGATAWCERVCYAANLERWPSVHALVMGNWSVYQSLKRSVPGLMDASRPMLDDLLADCERRGVDPVWRWFWARRPNGERRIPLVVWSGKVGVGACVECGMCINGVNNVRFAAA